MTAAPASEPPHTPTPDTGLFAGVVGASPRSARKKFAVATTGPPGPVEPSTSSRPGTLALDGTAAVGFKTVEASALFAWPSTKLLPVAAAAGSACSAVTPAAPAAPAAAIPARRSSSRRL